MSVSRHVYPDVASAAEACASHITSILESALHGQDYATVAISGGGTPRLLFDALARSGFPWDRVHFFWADERCVPPSDPQSNFLLAERHLFVPGRVPGHNVHRIFGEIPPEEAAPRYVQEIRAFFGLDEGELPHFDVIQLGMGPDGHTASLFPGSPALDDRHSIASAVYVEHLQQWRVTLMPAVLLAGRHAVFLVGGEDKAEAVHKVFDGEYDPHRCPAQLPSRHGRRVAWFLDRAALGTAG